MALYKRDLPVRRFPLVRRELGADHYQEIAARALENSINHLNTAYAQKLSGAEGAVEFRDEGVFTYDVQGRRYLDCLGGFGIFNLGHRHPKVIDAVKRQLDQVCLHSQELINPWAAHLASQLAAIAPGDLQYSFFCNSGTEAVEGAIKLARMHSGKTEIISTKNSYHGVSLGALSATGRDVFRKPFEPLLNGFLHVPFGDVEALEAAINENTAAVILEPIQGEGGIHVPPEGYLARVREITKNHGVLLILDEVQTGMGRTGRMFACQHEGVVPDILCLAKALGGGVMPIGCFMASAEVWKVLEPNPSIHNSTFGGNPLACTAASACIEVLLEERLAARAALMGSYFLRRLQELKARYPKHIEDVRGKGLLIGLQFKSEKLRQAVQVELFHRGVLVAGTLNSNKTFRIEPPLIITEGQIDFMIQTLEGIVSQLSDEDLAKLEAGEPELGDADLVKLEASEPELGDAEAACASLDGFTEMIRVVASRADTVTTTAYSPPFAESKGRKRKSSVARARARKAAGGTSNLNPVRGSQIAKGKKTKKGRK
jgi:putrescine aminotransferase